MHLRPQRDGLLVEANGDTSMLPWGAVRDVVRTRTHTFFFLTPNQAIIIPRRFFPDAATADRFTALAEEYRLAGRPVVPPIRAVP